MTFAAVVRSELADGVADQIRDAILAGEYQPGDLLPSERELSQQFDANRTTIREGLAQLEHQGLIERRQGARGRVLDYRSTGSIELLPDLVRLSRAPSHHGRAVAARVDQRGAPHRLRRCPRPRVRAHHRRRDHATRPARARRRDRGGRTRRRRGGAREPCLPPGRRARDALDRARAPGGQLLPRRSMRPRRAPASAPAPSATRSSTSPSGASAFPIARWPTPSPRASPTKHAPSSTGCSATANEPQSRPHHGRTTDDHRDQATASRRGRGRRDDQARPERGGHDLRVELRARA